jgi:hypothetical protein
MKRAPAQSLAIRAITFRRRQNKLHAMEWRLGKNCRDKIGFHFVQSPLQASIESTHSRAGPLESFVTPSGFLTTDDVDPPWLDYEGPVTYEAAIRRQRKPGGRPRFGTKFLRFSSQD